MSTPFSMLMIMNAALLAQGQDEIVAENDGSIEWSLLSRNWAQIVEKELETSRYFFTRREDFLNANTAGSYGFDYKYLLPLDVSHVRHAWRLLTSGDRETFQWSCDGDSLYCDIDDGVYIEGTIISDPSVWTATFSLGVQQRLEALILRALKEEFSEAAEMERLAAMTLQEARTNSSQLGRPPPAFKPGRVALARFGGRFTPGARSGES